MRQIKLLISYARADGAKASKRLHDSLTHVGYDVWRDIEDMRGGQDWKRQLRDAIASVDVILVLFTPSAVMSEYVLWECDTAETLNKKIIGLLIEPCDVPNDLSHLHYHDLTTPSKYDAGYSKLIRDLNELMTKEPVISSQKQPIPPASKFTVNADKMDNVQVGDGNIQTNNAPLRQKND
ncbi:MAG: TIR domain-containing protein, partial [Anaerolineae bacterium]|nr:TIR domain-containing protein [Anaerolineae bacterium]